MFAMVKVYPVIGACLSIASLVLLGIGASTNKWVVFDRNDQQRNPKVTNDKLGTVEQRIGITSGTAEIVYSVYNFGLWIGCHKENKAAVTCAYIRTKCHSNVCWVRKTTVSSTKTCQDERIKPVVNCTSFQVVRAFAVLGMIILVFGVSTQLVSLITVNRSLAMLAGLVIFISGLFVMTAFAVFYGENWVKAELADIGHLGYSFKLVVASWPLSLLAGLISCCAASMGLRHKEVSDYSASTY